MRTGSSNPRRDAPIMRELRDLPAPAKLNLFLRVTGRRNDGYHLLETVFELVDLADRIDLRLRDDDVIRLTAAPGDWAADDDLAVRAARLLARYARERAGGPGHAPAGAAGVAGVDITLRKHNPDGAGLGGGSSDAATVLLGLNRLWRLALPPDELRSLAVQLGADVPFFLYGRRAFARGIGEALTAVGHELSWYVAVVPPVRISTREVFARFGAASGPGIARRARLTERSKPSKITGSSRGRFVLDGENELESVVVSGWPVVAEALQRLRDAVDAEGADGRLARMSGSGASVFCPVPDETVARLVRQRLQRGVPGRVFAVRSLERHPLREDPFVTESGFATQRLQS